MEATATKATFQKYTAYKDSGVEWMGQIPTHWDMLPNKFIFKLKKNLVGKKSNQYTLLSLTLNGIIKRDMENPQGKFPAEFDTYQEVNNGDFIFCLFDVEETPRCVGLSDFDGMITGAYTVMQVGSKFNKRFLYYFYLNVDKDKRLRPLYTGLRNTISKDNFFAFKAFVPPLPEQTAIAAFLDNKTAKIEGAITQKEKMIALLKERKQIIIQNAVTKGLDPNAKMKDSGVEWIGEIPDVWEVKRLKFLLNELNIRSETGAEELLSLSKYSGVIPKSSLEERAGGAESLVGYKIVKENHLVINKMQAVNGLIAVAKISGITSPDYSIYFVKDESVLNINYLCQLILQPQYLAEFKRRVTGVMEGFIRLYTDDLYDVTISLPPIQEQTAIVAHIETQSTKIDKAIKLQEQQIEKLKELKSTLIDSAVTGKIKVS
jgi:type I restriction enzyme S subunit